MARLLALRPDGERRTCALLAGLALVPLVVYAAYALVLPLTPGYMAKPSASLIPELALWRLVAGLGIPGLENPLVVGASLIVGSVLVFGAYAAALWLTWNRSSRRLVGLITTTSLLFFFVSALAQPNITRNIYNYIMRGRLAGVYAVDPYTVAADRYASDPVYVYANPRYTATPGGKLPGWMWINGALARVAGDDPVSTLLVYRGAFLLFNAATLLLLASILARWYPLGLATGLALWGWNPIVVAYGQSKTDTVMVFYLVAAIWLLQLGWRRLATVPLVCSILVKLVTLPLLAVAGLRELRLGRWKEAVIMGVVSLGVVTALYLPYGDGNPLGVLFGHLGLAGSESGTVGGGIVRKLLGLGFAGLVLGVGLRQKGDDRQLIRGWSVVALYFSLFIAKFPSADYLMTLIALVALSCEVRLTLITLVVAGAAFTFSVWYQTSTPELVLPDVFPIPTRAVYLAPPALVAVGILAAGLIRWRAARPNPAARATVRVASH